MRDEVRGDLGRHQDRLKSGHVDIHMTCLEWLEMRLVKPVYLT